VYVAFAAVTRPRRDALDGLRALAALSVLAFHAWLYRPGAPPGPREAIGDHVLFELCRGLVLFFVLSGFLLYRPITDWRRFALRRVARLVPAYYACIVVCVLLFGAPPGLPLFAVLAQNYSAETVMQVNPVTWTLCIEAAFYVLLPLLALRVRAAVPLLLVGVTLAWSQLAEGFLATKMLPAWLGHFALGMLVAVWFRRRPRELGPGVTGALVACGAALVALDGWWHETAAPDAFVRAGLATLPAAAGFALIVAAAVAGRGPAVAWLRSRPLVAVGVISYGVYLWHVPLLLAARDAGVLPGSWAGRVALVLPPALALGALSWRLVERPSIRWAAAWRGREPAVAPRSTTA
jgi:peptidoglycan/LPS O-acetylase OafA/YrhL